MSLFKAAVFWSYCWVVPPTVLHLGLRFLTCNTPSLCPLVDVSWTQAPGPTPTAAFTLPHCHRLFLQGIQFLIENDLLKNTCEDIAQFLYKGEGLNKTAIGDYLGER